MRGPNRPKDSKRISELEGLLYTACFYLRRSGTLYNEHPSMQKLLKWADDNEDRDKSGAHHEPS